MERILTSEGSLCISFCCCNCSKDENLQPPTQRTAQHQQHTTIEISIFLHTYVFRRSIHFKLFLSVLLLLYASICGVDVVVVVVGFFLPESESTATFSNERRLIRCEHGQLGKGNNKISFSNMFKQKNTTCIKHCQQVSKVVQHHSDHVQHRTHNPFCADRAKKCFWSIQ